MALRVAFPDGHFYSPVVNTDEAAHDERQIWPDEPLAPGIDFNLESHDQFLAAMSKHLVRYDYPLELLPGQVEDHFYQLNSQFGPMDSRALFTMLMERPPKQMIEVGSGYSSLVTADVNVRFLNRSIEFICIEPYPRQFLIDGVDGIAGVVQKRVQEVPIAAFQKLGAGDILFIDSSHVSKTGSDVNHLFLQVLPLLQPGVIVHVHDIFLPGDYLKQWVVDEGRSWNEQYLLQAMLAHSTRYKIIYGTSSAIHFRSAALVEATKSDALYGGSIWFEVQ